jgi:hypothetical protein
MNHLITKEQAAYAWRAAMLKDYYNGGASKTWRIVFLWIVIALAAIALVIIHGRSID